METSRRSTEGFYGGRKSRYRIIILMEAERIDNNAELGFKDRVHQNLK